MPDPATVSTVHQGFTVATSVALVVGGPLLAYIVRLKDREVRELWKKLEGFKAESDKHDEEAAGERKALNERCHALDLRAAELTGEVKVANEVKAELKDLAAKVDKIGRDVADLRGALRVTRSSSRSSDRLPVVSEPPRR